MGKINLRNKKGGKTLLILAGFGALAYLRNRLIPMFADDYAFSFIWDGKHHGNLAFGKQRYYRVKKSKDLIRSQVSHYLGLDRIRKDQGKEHPLLPYEGAGSGLLDRYAEACLYHIVADWRYELFLARGSAVGISPSLQPCNKGQEHPRPRSGSGPIRHPCRLVK